MAKTLCEWDKWEIMHNIEELAAVVRDPRYVCRKCARSAHKEKHLCKPIPLPVREHVVLPASHVDNDDV